MYYFFLTESPAPAKKGNQAVNCYGKEASGRPRDYGEQGRRALHSLL